MTDDEKKSVESLSAKHVPIPLNPNDAIPPRLYHYTSPAGLLGIISSGVLRATNFSYFNDSAEVTHGLQILRPLIVERRWPTTQVKEALEKACDEVGRDFYVACFCAESDLLSQWRGYGAAKGRYCIGFGFDLPPWGVSPPPAGAILGYVKGTKPHGLPCTLDRVLYDECEQRQKLDQALDQAMDLARESMEVHHSEESHKLIGAILAEKLVREICFFKHPGFREEKEWRAVHQARQTDQIEFEVASGVIKPYVKLWGEVGPGAQSLPIAEILIGASGLPGPLSRKTVQLLLDRYNYPGVIVSESAVPYRDL